MTLTQQTTSTSGDTSDDVFIVERIISKRMKNDKPVYLCKWKGYRNSENTWEPYEHVKNLAILPDFEQHWKEIETKRLKKMVREPSKRKVVTKVCDKVIEQAVTVSEQPKPDCEELKKAKSEEQESGQSSCELNGFESGWEPEFIDGATKHEGMIWLSVKWKGREKSDFVPAPLARLQCPQLVLDFYEERLTWPEAIDEDNENE